MSVLLSHPILASILASSALSYLATLVVLLRTKKIVYGYEDHTGFHSEPVPESLIVPADEVCPSWLNASMRERFMASGLMLRTA